MLPICFPRCRMKLTKAIVAGLALPQGKSEMIVFDEALPGFGLRIRSGASVVGSRNTASGRNSAA